MKNYNPDILECLKDLPEKSRYLMNVCGMSADATVRVLFFERGVGAPPTTYNCRSTLGPRFEKPWDGNLSGSQTFYSFPSALAFKIGFKYNGPV